MTYARMVYVVGCMCYYVLHIYVFWIGIQNWSTQTVRLCMTYDLVHSVERWCNGAWSRHY